MTTFETNPKVSQAGLERGICDFRADWKPNLTYATSNDDPHCARDAQLKEADANVNSLRDEALEREDVIGQNYGTIQLLRQQVGELEKSKFVMGFHAKVGMKFKF